MVTSDLFLIDSTFSLKASEVSFVGAPLILGPDGQDHTRTFGFVRDILMLRKRYSIRHATIVIGQESASATTEEILSDLLPLLTEIKATTVRHVNVRVGEICGQLAPTAQWIVTANRAMLQLVSEALGVILLKDGDVPELFTKKGVMDLGIRPDQVPSLLALSVGKEAPPKKKQAIRLLQLYESIDAALADCSTAPSTDWKRKLAPKKE